MSDIAIRVENLFKHYHIGWCTTSQGLTGWENISLRGTKGINDKDGENFLIANCTEDFVAAIPWVLREAGINQALWKNWRRLLETHYDWRKMYPVWEAIDAG